MATTAIMITAMMCLLLRGNNDHDTNAVRDNLKRTQCLFQTKKSQGERLTRRYSDVRVEASSTQELVTAALVVDQKSATTSRTNNATSCKRGKARCRMNHVIVKQKKFLSTTPSQHGMAPSHQHVNQSKQFSTR